MIVDFLTIKKILLFFDLIFIITEHSSILSVTKENLMIKQKEGEISPTERFNA